MSLLGGMIAGGLSGGANAAYDMADKTIDHNRRTDMSDLEFKRNTALEQMRTQSAMARDDINYSRQTEQRQQDREWAESDWEKKAAHDMRIAGMRSSGTGTATKLPPEAAALWNQVEHYRKVSEIRELTPEETSAYQQAMNGYQLFTGTASFGAPRPLADPEDTEDDTLDTEDDTFDYATASSIVRGTGDEKPATRGLLGVSAEQVDASPSVQKVVEGRDRNNETMARQAGAFKDRFFNKEMQESEQVAFRRFGERKPIGNPEWEQWLQKNYPSVYQRRVEHGEINQ